MRRRVPEGAGRDVGNRFGLHTAATSPQITDISVLFACYASPDGSNDPTDPPEPRAMLFMRSNMGIRLFSLVLAATVCTIAACSEDPTTPPVIDDGFDPPSAWSWAELDRTPVLAQHAHPAAKDQVLLEAQKREQMLGACVAYIRASETDPLQAAHATLERCESILHAQQAASIS